MVTKRQLRIKLDYKDTVIENLQKEVEQLKQALETIEDARKVKPEGCVEGPWCDGCDYQKMVHYGGSTFSRTFTVKFCGKGEACSEFLSSKNTIICKSGITSVLTCNNGSVSVIKEKD